VTNDQRNSKKRLGGGVTEPVSVTTLIVLSVAGETGRIQAIAYLGTVLQHSPNVQYPLPWQWALF